MKIEGVRAKNLIKINTLKNWNLVPYVQTQRPPVGGWLISKKSHKSIILISNLPPKYSFI